MSPAPNEDFCRKLCEEFAFIPYPGHPNECPCEDCNNSRCAKHLVITAIQIVMEKAARQESKELVALRKFKEAVDLAVTAGLLGMSGEVGFKLPCHAFVTSIKVSFRQAESEYMRDFGADSIRSLQLSAEDVADSL